MCRIKFQEQILCVNVSTFTKHSHQSAFLKMQWMALVLILTFYSIKRRKEAF